jgi:hypothetical protein
LVHRSRELGS